jgi:cysteine desulfurase / selenocysteine lyase
VTGAMTDVARVVVAAECVGAKVALDGAQGAPHGPFDVRQAGIDFYAFSGHKTYGPTGIGVLWGREDLLEAMPLTRRYLMGDIFSTIAGGGQRPLIFGYSH